MRENLSARGSLDDWIDASEEALWNAGFERVEVDEHFDRLAADIGENGYIDINFLIQNDGRVRLEIDASDKELIDSLKPRWPRSCRTAAAAKAVPADVTATQGAVVMRTKIQTWRTTMAPAAGAIRAGAVRRAVPAGAGFVCPAADVPAIPFTPAPGSSCLCWFLYPRSAFF